MTKTFCDSCGKELKFGDNHNVEIAIGDRGVFTIIAWTCRYQIIDAIKKLDDRPQPTQKENEG